MKFKLLVNMISRNDKVKTHTGNLTRRNVPNEIALSHNGQNPLCRTSRVMHNVQNKWPQAVDETSSLIIFPMQMPHSRSAPASYDVDGPFDEI